MSDVKEAGRELDALIAEGVMGLTVGACVNLRYVRMGDTVHRHHIPRYSTDIASAWEVVEKMKEWHQVVLTGGPNDEGGCGDWLCTIKSYGYRSFQDQHWAGRAETAPLAICLAALCATPTTASVTVEPEEERENG